MKIRGECEKWAKIISIYIEIEEEKMGIEYPALILIIQIPRK